MFRLLARKMMALHKDEQGASMVEYALIIAAVALPVLAVILWYRNEIAQWAKDKWEVVKGTSDPTTP